MNKTHIIVSVLILAIIGYVAYGQMGVTADKQPTADSTVQENYEDAEVVMIGVKGGSYVPDPVRVKAGQPTILRNDGSIGGCAMFLVQPELGIKADFSKTKDYHFTPTKKGTYTIACSMNMYRGTMEVI